MSSFFTQLISAFRRNNSGNRFFVFATVLAFLLVGVGKVGWGQVNISPGSTITQNFDGIGTSATATLPTGWKMENVTGARTVNTAYASVANTATALSLVFNAALSSTAGNGRYNFGGTSATDRSIGGLSSASASQSVNMFLQLTNNGASSIFSFTISYDAERYRNGTNAAGFSIRFYYSTTGNAGSWVEVPGMIASFAGANADNNGSTTNPMQTISISNQTLSQSVSASGSIYFAWSYSVTSGTTTSNGQALGIDNISITANAAPCTAPSTQASNIIFPTAGATSMSVNWTNGNGAGRVVKMNTTNSFTAPTDGSNPTANLTYAGSGEQVVFNGTGSGPITITGLTASTTYHFRVYEYCSPDRNYQTATATNNPNSQATSAGGTPILGISGTTSHGAVCPNVSATSVQYTINNTGSVTADGINVSSNDPQFVVSSLSSTSIAAGGSVTFNVTFTPSSAGSKSATITVTSTTGGSNSPTTGLTGTGTTPVSPAITTNTASGVTNTTATLNGNLGTLGVCPATTEKGFVYSVTTTNSNPTVGGSGVTQTSVDGLTTGDFTLALSSLSNQTGYTFRAYVFDGSTYTYGTAQSFTTLSAPCLTEAFASVLPSGWIQTSVTFAGYADFSLNTGSLTTVAVANPNTLTFTLTRTANATDKTMLVEVSTTSQSSGFTTVATYNHSNTTSAGTTSCSVDLSAYTASSVVYIRFTKSSSTTSYWRLDDVNVFCTPSPEINVKQGAANLASGSGNYSFGTITQGNSSSAITFTVENTGSASLSLSGTPKVAISGHTSDFTIDQTATSSTVSAAGSTTFTITFNPTTTGTRTATISIANSDANENPYTFTVTGIGNSPTAPEINLKQGATNIASAGSYAFGSQTAATSSAAVTFTIENTGNADLTLSGTPKVAISGSNAAEFTVDQTSITSPVGAGSSTTFTITFSPTSVGAKSATITIANDDVDEGSYTFTLTGTGALATEPTAAPTSMVFSSVTNIGFNVSFTAASGSPTGYLVLRRSVSAPTGTPIDGTTYTVGQMSIAGGNNTVAYVGAWPSPNFLENTLTADTRYYYVVYSYNGSGAGINYLTSSTLSGNRFTLATEPTAQGAPSVTNIQTTSMQLTGFNSGDGASVIIVAKQGSAVDASPIDGVNYSASATFGSGAHLGGGNYVVGINPTDPLTVTGLTPGVTYHFATFDYNGTLANQSANFLTGSPGRASGTTTSNTSDIIAVAGSEAVSVSSLTNTTTISTAADGTQVWQFTIRDGGGTPDADNLPTIVNTLVFTQNTSNQMDNFLNSIQSIALFNGSTLISNTPSITATQISFAGLSLTVPDNGSLTVSVRLSVKANVNAGASTGVNADGDDFVFQLTASNQVTGSATSSSQFVSTFSPVAASANSSNVYSVIATKLSFVQQPPVSIILNSAMSPAVTVSAEDAGGNRDLNYGTSVSVTSTGTLSGTPVSVSPVAGLATFSALTHISLGTSLTLTATSGSLSSVTSDPFNVTSNPTTLSAGDIAVIAVQSNSTTDKFSFVLLRDITTGTVINFTDNGYTSSPASGATNEGFVTYTAPSALCAGTVLSWQSGQTGSGWSTSGSLNLAQAGDQLFAFAGSTSNWASQTSITFLYAIQWINSYIVTGSTTANTSYAPPLATTYSLQLAGSNDGFYFTNTILSGTPAQIVTALTTAGNLTSLQGTYTTPTYSVTIHAGVANRPVNRFAAITPIVITLENGATGANVTGLPPGVTSSVTSGVLTIKNAPTQSGNYLYTVTTTGGTCASTYVGTISVTAAGPNTAPYRTISNGDFTTSSIWEFFNGDEWQAASTPPENPAGLNNLTIRHAVNFNTNYTVGTLNSVEVVSNGIITIASGTTVDFSDRPVVIRSGASGTGAIGQISGTLNGASVVTVERYIPARRAWRMLTAPLKGSSNNSIFANWQNSGQGVTIWAPAGVPSPAANNSGILAGGIASSILSYNGTEWVGPASTTSANSLFGSDNGTNKSYAIFVTGPYSGSNTSPITGSATATTLSATGTLQQGTVSFSNLTSGQFHLIGNPYPSAVNLSGTATGTNGAFYVWDAQAGSLGAYKTWQGGSWVSPPEGSDYSNAPIIQSGQAFFINATGTASVTFTESNKASNNAGTVGFRTYNTNDQRLRVRLSRIVNNVPNERDAVLARFDGTYSPAVDDQDIVKANNFSENMALVRSGSNLVIERRSLQQPNDTLFLRLWNTAATNYELEFSYENFQLPVGTTVVLRDAFLGTEQTLQPGVLEKIAFAVTADAKSTGDRFQVVFRNNTVTPVRDLNGAKGFAVYPNPVAAGSKLQLQFRNRTAGKYQVVLFNMTGSQVLQQVVQHGGGTAVQLMEMPAKLTAGIYIAEITDAKGTKEQVKIHIQ